MRTGFLGALASMLIAAPPLFAQTPAEPPADTNASETVAPFSISDRDPAQVLPYQTWMSAGYLAFWVKNAPLPVSPLTGNPANPTQPLLGTDQNYGMFSGFRVDAGTWLNLDNTLGLDAGYFMLAQRSRTFTASSDATGNPVLALPFTNQSPGAVGNVFMPIASPGAFAGSVAVSSSLQLWGTEGNTLIAMARVGGFQAVGLLGIRYVNLHETLDIDSVSSDILTTPATVLTQSDRFSTTNQFYGGQLGARVGWQGDVFGLDATGKLALGATHESLDIQGASVQTGPGGVNGVFPGGLYAQPSNIGHYNTNRFSLLPSIEARVSMLITPQLRVFVGYNLLYWTQVLRPGNQLDTNLNLTQSAVLGNGTLIGPGNPMPLLTRSDFWAQGVNLGLEFRF